MLRLPGGAECLFVFLLGWVSLTSRYGHETKQFAAVLKRNVTTCSIETWLIKYFFLIRSMTTSGSCHDSWVSSEPLPLQSLWSPPRGSLTSSSWAAKLTRMMSRMRGSPLRFPPRWRHHRSCDDHRMDTQSLSLPAASHRCCRSCCCWASLSSPCSGGWCLCPHWWLSWSPLDSWPQCMAWPLHCRGRNSAQGSACLWSWQRRLSGELWAASSWVTAESPTWAPSLMRRYCSGTSSWCCYC